MSQQTKKTTKGLHKSGDQPSILQSMSVAGEARTRSQTAKLAKSPNMGETEDFTDHDDSSIDFVTAMKKVQESLHSVEEKIGNLTTVATEMSTLKRTQEALRKEAKNAKFKVNVLTNVVIRLEEKLDMQSEKIMQMQARSMRKNVIISGLEDDKKPQVETQYSLRQKVDSFMLDKLKLSEPIELKACHRFGQIDGSGTRPVVIKVKDIDDKYAILAKGPNLKDLVNANGKKYFVSEQLPDKLQEERRYNQHWVQENKHNPQSKMDMKIFRNKLRINNDPYVRKVKTPTAAEILRLDENELLTVRQVTLHDGGTKDEQGSEFLAFAANVQTAEDVRQAYRKLKIKYADASHISSAYRLDPPNGPLNQEADDDGEYGMGRFLLRLLQEGKAVNVAVFILRYYGGVHIGSKRFEIARLLGKQALKNAGKWQFDMKKQSPRHQRPRSARKSPPQGQANSSQSESEPEVVKQAKKRFGSQVVLPGNSDLESASEREAGKADDTISGVETQSEYDASHDDEESDYDEATSQPDLDRITGEKQMPDLESTQQQQVFLNNIAFMKQQEYAGESPHAN